jgi:hypothetical protein
VEPTTLSLTPLEAAVLREHCNQLPAQDAAALQTQIETVSVLRRENTGAGFFTYLSTRHTETALQIKTDTRECHIVAKIGDIEDALGFILWMRDGHVHCLEGYTLALESTSKIDFSVLDFELRSTPRP